MYVHVFKNSRGPEAVKPVEFAAACSFSAKWEDPESEVGYLAP